MGTPSTTTGRRVSASAANLGGPLTPTTPPRGRTRSTATTAFTSARTWRALLVSLHVISSVCWLGQALSLIALLALSASSPPGETKIAAAAMANELDLRVLGFSAMIAALTGLGLSAATAWGYFHHWWVSAKFVLTTAQLALGTVVIGRTLPTVVDAAQGGGDGAALPVTLGLGAVAGGLAAQVWLSTAKPGGRTPRGRRAESRLPTAPVGVFVMLAVLPLVDTALHVIASVALPFLSAIGLVVALVLRRRHGRRATRHASTIAPARPDDRAAPDVPVEGPLPGRRRVLGGRPAAGSDSRVAP